MLVAVYHLVSSMFAVPDANRNRDFVQINEESSLKKVAEGMTHDEPKVVNGTLDAEEAIEPYGDVFASIGGFAASPRHSSFDDLLDGFSAKERVAKVCSSSPPTKGDSAFHDPNCYGTPPAAKEVVEASPVMKITEEFFGAETD
ncbi:hypothetical protein SUGI_0978870 [Cryptomeria japonica]|nr:hypothetical protein SUGI_0978870 [Cryptomeria japonica]